ncbi:ABC transporter substrate-binding protein [Pseudorhodoplanes sp.]|uniref:ABC transporter substrate-binding protein n=1 Tax=Pseudorhodoplanes sp. TaxID=1934341 RepID=UPI0039198BBA
MKTLLSVLAALAFGASGPASANAQEPVRLGFLSSMSGTFGVLGAEQKRGLDLALEHLGNKLGGRPVKLVEIDDKSSPVDAADAANRMVEREKIQIVTGLVSSNSMLAAIDPLLKNSVFVVGANAGPSVLAGEKCDQNLFVVAFANEQWGIGLADYLNRAGVKRMMFLGMDYQAGWDHAKSVAKNFNGENLGEIYTPLTQLDFSSVLTQVRAAKPDAVYAFYVGAAAVPFMKQWKQSGLDKTVKLYSMGAIADSMLLPAIGEAALGLETAYSWNPEMKTPGNERFVEDFRKKHGRNPTQFAMFQYDAIMLLDAAVRESGPENTEAFRAALKKADFKSLRGNFKFNNNNFPIQDIILQRVERTPDGKVDVRFVEVIKKDVKDPHHGSCPLKD